MEDVTTTAINPKTGEKHTFAFDYSFWSFDNNHPNAADQKTVFDALGILVLQNAWDGYNTCCFAYGQTGTGKSYSMVGNMDDKGIIPRTCDEMFVRISKNEDPNLRYEVEASMFEIYNEEIRDLLVPKSKQKALRVREHPVTGPYVEDLSWHIVHNYEEIDKLMQDGEKMKTKAETKMNDKSSRAHTIVQIVFKQITTVKNKDGKDVKTEKQSRISLVDLAGSERQSKTEATGERLKEGIAINQSLTALGDCISALVDREKNKNVFIPYRNSTLTWILKESLGGNSKTIMIAAIGPADFNYDETLSTLRYANRVKSIKTVAKVNEDPNAKMIRELKEEIERLQKELQNKPMSDGELLSELEQSRKLYEELQMSYEEKERQTAEYKKLREEIFMDWGLSIVEIGKYFGFDPYTTPYLINTVPSFDLDDGFIFFLRIGPTTVGREGKNIIVLKGESIRPEHCIFGRDEDSDAVIILPVNESPVYVNGKLITEQTELKCNDIIALDKMHVFRLYTPFGPKHEEIETVEHTDTKEEILELNEKLKNKDEEITKLQGERDSLQSQIIALNEKLKIKDEELNKLQGERDSLQSTELNKLKEERDSLQNQCTELKQKIKVMVDEMEKASKISREENETLKKQIKELQEKLLKAESQPPPQPTPQPQTSDKTDTRIQELEQQIEQLKQEGRNLTNLCSEMEKSRNSEKKKVEELESVVNILKQTISRLEQELKEATEAQKKSQEVNSPIVTAQSPQIESQNEEIKQLKMQNEQLIKEITLLRNENDRLKEKKCNCCTIS